ncbi:MAG: hypothetical protein ACOC85_03515 [Thermoplasmatota archaeon]
MGKSVPTYRIELDNLIFEWKKFRRALRKEEREKFDKLIEQAKKHASTSQYEARIDPVESLFMSILLEHQIKLDRLERRINNERLDIGCLSQSKKGKDGSMVEDREEML